MGSARKLRLELRQTNSLLAGRLGRRSGQAQKAPSYGPIFVPIASPETMISTRRFCWRPAGVSLLATGSA